MTKKLSDVEWAYLAGLFDGEGSVSIVSHTISSRPMLQVNITQKDPMILEWAQQVLGYGSIGKTQSQCHRFIMSGRLNQRHFLRGIYPHCRIKKRKVLIAEAFTRAARASETKSQLQGLFYKEAE